MDDFYRNVIGPYWPRQRRHVEEGYRNLRLPLAAMAAPGFELETHWSVDEALGYLDTWSAVRRYRAARGRDPLELLAPGLRRAWGGDHRLLSWPLQVRAGRR